MKTVQRFQADDGRLFDDEAKCNAHDEIVAIARDIDALIGPRVKDDRCDFANGGGFVQRDAIDIIRAKAKLKEESVRIHGKYHPRILDDGGCPLANPDARLRCIDFMNREWGQPFYANNPKEGTQVEWSR